MSIFSNLFSIGGSLQNINYGEHILKSIIATKYAKRKLTILLMLFITSILRFHIVSIITILFSVNIYVNFIVQIIISVIAVLQTHRIYRFVEINTPILYRFTRYIINNYTPKRYRKWKRNVTISLCIYIIIIFSIFEVTSNLVILYTIQYMISYCIVDIIEQRKIEKLIQRYKDRPKRVIYAEFNVIDNFYKTPEIEKFFLDEKSYDYISSTHEQIKSLKNNDKELSNSHGKIGFVIIDDYQQKPPPSSAFYDIHSRKKNLH